MNVLYDAAVRYCFRFVKLRLLLVQDEVRKVVERTMWYPSYPPLIFMKDE